MTHPTVPPHAIAKAADEALLLLPAGIILSFLAMLCIFIPWFLACTFFHTFGILISLFSAIGVIGLSSSALFGWLSERQVSFQKKTHYMGIGFFSAAFGLLGVAVSVVLMLMQVAGFRLPWGLL